MPLSRPIRTVNPPWKRSTVLRLSSDRILIALAPDSLALLRVSGGARPRVSEKLTIACDPALGTAPWQGAAAALGELASETRDANAAVTVVLSNHFARFILVPWSEGLGNAEEEAAFVRYCFAKVHGERSKERRVGKECRSRWSPYQ